jgi:hypothetical protein
MDERNGGTSAVSTVPVICGSHGLRPVPSQASGGIHHAPVVPLPRLLCQLAAAERTGVLTIDRGTAVRSIYLKHGSILWAESAEPGQRFSEWLATRGLVSDEHLEAARRLVANGACRFGEALLRLDAIGPSELGRAAERFIVELVVSTLSWREGTYTFVEPAAPARDFAPPVFPTRAISAEAVVVEGFAREIDVGLVTLWLGDLSVPRMLRTDPYRYFAYEDLSERHASLLRGLETATFTVVDVVESSPLDSVETLRILGTLDAVGSLVCV